LGVRPIDFDYMSVDLIGSEFRKKNLVRLTPIRPGADYGFGGGLAVRAPQIKKKKKGPFGDREGDASARSTLHPAPAANDTAIGRSEEDVGVIVGSISFCGARPACLWHYRQKINALVYQAWLKEKEKNERSGRGRNLNGLLHRFFL